MTIPGSQPVHLDVVAELSAVGTRVTAARDAYLAADDWYDADGRQLEDQVVEHIEHFRDPARNRARAIQDAARDLDAQLPRFSGERATLATRAADLLLCQESAVLSLGVDMLDLQLPEMDPANDLRGSLHAFMNTLSEAQQRNLFLAARAVMIGNATEQALQTLTNPISIRAATLEAYLAAVGATDAALTQARPSIFGVVVNATALEVTLVAAEHVMGIAATALGIAVPVAGLAVLVLSIALDVREQQRETAQRYQDALAARFNRSDVDEMFDLEAQLADEDESLRDAEQRVATLNDQLTAITLP